MILSPRCGRTAAPPSPRFVRAVETLARSDRLFAVSATAEDARTAALPRPRFVRAVAGVAMSDRLFAVWRKKATF